MDITYIPPQRQALLLLYSLIIGFITGSAVGILRSPADILRNILTNNNKICIIIDILFDIIMSILYILVIITFIYAANEGIIRVFMLLTTFLGILLYKISLGKLQNKISKALSKVIKRITVFVIKTVRRMIYPLKAAVKSSRVKRYIDKGIGSAAGR